MSLYKDIQESHDSIKALGLSTLISPFWYLSIYLFNPKWYSDADIIIKIVISALLSIMSVLFLSVYLSQIKGNKLGLINNTVGAVYFLSIWKAVLMFVTYTFCFLTDNEIYFYGYIVIYFFPLIFILATRWVSNKLEKKK